MPGAQFTPHVSQNSPSRLGQQPPQRFNHGRPNAGRAMDRNHISAQLPPSNTSSGGQQRSPRSSSYTNGVPWGIHSFSHLNFSLQHFVFPSLRPLFGLNIGDI